MIIKKYGIELVRLSEQDLELVRQKRNSPQIKNKMFFQKEISPEEQISWFQSIQNGKNYYFIIKNKGEKVGLIHGIIRSYTKKIAEGGMFIWDANCLKSHIPVIASVCMTDMTFLIMKMNKTLAEIRNDNLTAINYNLGIGYRIVKEEAENNKILMELTQKDYFEKAAKVRETVKKISRETGDLTWDNIEINPKDYEKLYHKLPDYLRKEILQKIDLAS